MSFRQKLPKLENDPASIRNVCILAHIDHGKTSLSDCMLASNGIISQHHQGEIRFLDSRADEQERGITMEASSISLFARTLEREFVINLIDSPGHVDFSSEVTQASRLCDSAIILVDALEGVCSQTVSALKQAWDEELQSILVVNKIDKLHEEWQLTPGEAAAQLTKVVEQVNAVWGQFYLGRRMETEEDNDDVVYFSPSEDNVVFCSALHGWGFTIRQFANMFEKKLGVDRQKLSSCLWGDFYLDPKTKKVVSGASTASSMGKRRKNMFTQFIMDNIWAVYDAAVAYDQPKIEKIVQALSLKEVRDVSDPKEVFHQWIPLSRAMYVGIINLPSPDKAQEKRLDCLLRNTPHSESIDTNIRQALATADPKGPTLGYVSKVVSFKSSEIPEKLEDLSVVEAKKMRDEIEWKHQPEITNSDAVVLGFTRIYSGEIKVGTELDLLSPSYDPEKPQDFRSRVQVTGIYIFMGRGLISVSKAGPGAIVGLAGLDGTIVKSATLCSPQSVAPNLARSAQVAAPILRVAVEPKDPTKLNELEAGLELLNVADPSVDFQISDAGEFILSTAGELHLERCLRDLEERYAQVEMDVSPPVVPFRETIVPPFNGENPTEIDVGGFHLKLEVSPLEKKDCESSHIVSTVVDNILVDETPEKLLVNKKFGSQSILAGFRSAMASGPLLNEPMQGVKVIVKELENQSSESHANVIGQRRLISATKRSIVEAVEQWSPRVMLAMYRCDIQASTEVLGKVYAVINGRRGRVLSEELKEGTPFFLVTARIPVIESIGFSEEIRKRTSGAANPQLMFDGFEILEEDPYWVPTTEEELEELGEIADRENLALNYVNDIRKQKGLVVAEKLVKDAERDRVLRH